MVCHFEENHGGICQTLLMRTLKETRTALERQAWESVMIDRLARSPQQCLNLKNEWSLSRKPALENRGKIKEPAGTGKVEGYNPEQNKHKRGRQKEEVVRDTGQE